MKTSLSFLILVFLISIRPTDYTKIKKMNLTPGCEKQLQGCDDFKEPKQRLGSMQCKFYKSSCSYSCTLRCPRKDGKFLQISDKRYAKETFNCIAGVWKRKETPKAYCLSNSAVKEVRQNFYHMDELNTLIKTLFNTSYNLIGMATFYERADVALPGFSKLMSDLWQKEVQLARSMLSYINKRGGYISLFDIPSPSVHETLLSRLESKSGLAGMESALDILKDVNGEALMLHKQATDNKKMSDPHLKFFLEDGILSQKVQDIETIAQLTTRLKSFSDEDYPLGEYEVDLELR
ncbi:ferritin, middle subunit-like [Biomphalaria glabrata]|uniref:Ferritin n=1 Tax=Biomphalaria glabrata TaxID=6526 RepID=A0A9U8E6G2_BIOGL|nr:ferritin, middle subunit-like [Biomphalaria glabrata]